VTEALRRGGRVVEDEAERLFSPIDAGSAAGFRTYVRAGGRVSVEQSKRKTTGNRPQFGALQMREGLLPAQESKLEEVAGILDDEVGGLLHRNGF
jgi:hypothetical protein